MSWPNIYFPRTSHLRVPSYQQTSAKQLQIWEISLQGFSVSSEVDLISYCSSFLTKTETVDTRGIISVWYISVPSEVGLMSYRSSVSDQNWSCRHQGDFFSVVWFVAVYIYDVPAVISMDWSGVVSADPWISVFIVGIQIWRTTQNSQGLVWFESVLKILFLQAERTFDSRSWQFNLEDIRTACTVTTKT